MIKTSKLSKKDFTKAGLKKIVNRDISEINHLSDEDLISLWSFFKFLLTEAPPGDTLVFLTNKDSLIWKNKSALERHNVKIMLPKEVIAG